MAVLRIEVIGAGVIGRKHLSVLMAGPSFEVAAIADPTPAAAAFAAEHGIPYFAQYEEMLDKTRPDGVVIATPNQLHVEQGLACVSRKIPALIEKPIGDSVAAATDLVNAADKANVPILVGHHRRHNPIMQAAAQIINNGDIGKVTAVSAYWLNNKPDDYFDLTWRRERGGGPVLLNAIHDIDCLRMLCGEIESIYASTSNATRGFSVEDTAAGVIRFRSGALGSFIVSDTVSSPWNWEVTANDNPAWPHEEENSILITGTRGALGVPTLTHYWHGIGEGWLHPLKKQRAAYTPADSYTNQMKNLAGVIRGIERPTVSGIEGVRTLAATLAITESANTGKWVHLE